MSRRKAYDVYMQPTYNMSRPTPSYDVHHATYTFICTRILSFLSLSLSLSLSIHLRNDKHTLIPTFSDIHYNVSFVVMFDQSSLRYTNVGSTLGRVGAASHDSHVTNFQSEEDPDREKVCVDPQETCILSTSGSGMYICIELNVYCHVLVEKPSQKSRAMLN